MDEFEKRSVLLTKIRVELSVHVGVSYAGHINEMAKISEEFVQLHESEAEPALIALAAKFSEVIRAKHLGTLKRNLTVSDVRLEYEAYKKCKNRKPSDFETAVIQLLECAGPAVDYDEDTLVIDTYAYAEVQECLKQKYGIVYGDKIANPYEDADNDEDDDEGDDEDGKAREAEKFIRNQQKYFLLEPDGDKCCGQVRVWIGQRIPGGTWRRCGKKARAGKLTCRSHAKVEDKENV